jgi:methylenetetrahydrofolate dehydrogenase (NADP+)/methenyltetrahydrofolate cyclohydrolase
MSQARIIDGKAFAAQLREEVAAEVARLKAEHGLTPGLAVVLVGEDPASQVYVRSKGEQTTAAGMHSETHRLPAETSQAELLSLVERLNDDPAIHGVLVQFPVPDHMSQAAIVAAISPDKDVDGLTVTNAGRLASGLPALTSCTPTGCMVLLKDVVGDLSGKRAVVIGRSNLMGKPMAQLLLAADCTVTIAHSRSKDLPGICREADILVAAVGRPEMVKGDWIKPGATVIDVGITRFPAARSGSRGGRQDPAGRRRGLRRGQGRGRRHHPGAGRGGADDHRHAAGQHRQRRQAPERDRRIVWSPRTLAAALVLGGPGGLLPIRPAAPTAQQALALAPADARLAALYGESCKACHAIPARARRWSTTARPGIRAGSGARPCCWTTPSRASRPCRPADNAPLAPRSDFNALIRFMAGREDPAG